MREGKLNPFLGFQSTDMPRQLAHDFTTSGSPEQHFKRMQAACEAVGARLTIAYVPFCAVVSRRYVESLVRLGMDRKTAEAMSVDPIYRRQNRILAEVCRSLKLPLADTTDDLVRADSNGTPQYWSFDTHPRPAGYATIARCLHGRAWRSSMKDACCRPLAHFLSTSSRNVGPRKIQFPGVSEIGPLMPKIAI